ncbi:hypothetical protein Golob_027967 [Gossypium lobatum]|uniref:Uncharacterized protein n=1 Tax=Gossypium lobatum TaxID=34289 RepID=A0A7J8NKT0_9ROSI|nr:hypothetical protein [Gossypium lobatum]
MTAMKKVTKVRTLKRKRNTLRPGSHVATPELYVSTSYNPQNNGVNVLVIKRSICQFYDAPYYYHDYLYKTDLKELKNIDTKEILRILMEGKEIWTYWKGTAVP